MLAKPLNPVYIAPTSQAELGSSGEKSSNDPPVGRNPLMALPRRETGKELGHGAPRIHYASAA